MINPNWSQRPHTLKFSFPSCDIKIDSSPMWFYIEIGAKQAKQSTLNHVHPVINRWVGRLKEHKDFVKLLKNSRMGWFSKMWYTNFFFVLIWWKPKILRVLSIWGPLLGFWEVILTIFEAFLPNLSKIREFALKTKILPFSPLRYGNGIIDLVWQKH